MRKFSEIGMNEEFFGFGKKQEQTSFTKTSIRLMESYCKNLLSNEKIELHPDERANFDFTHYRVKSITKLGPTRFNVVIETFNDTNTKPGELSYNLEI